MQNSSRQWKIVPVAPTPRKKHTNIQYTKKKHTQTTLCTKNYSERKPNGMNDAQQQNELIVFSFVSSPVHLLSRSFSRCWALDLIRESLVPLCGKSRFFSFTFLVAWCSQFIFTIFHTDAVADNDFRSSNLVVLFIYSISLFLSVTFSLYTILHFQYAVQLHVCAFFTQHIWKLCCFYNDVCFSLFLSFFAFSFSVDNCWSL